MLGQFVTQTWPNYVKLAQVLTTVVIYTKVGRKVLKATEASTKYSAISPQIPRRRAGLWTDASKILQKCSNITKNETLRRAGPWTDDLHVLYNYSKNTPGSTC